MSDEKELNELNDELNEENNLHDTSLNLDMTELQEAEDDDIEQGEESIADLHKEQYKQIGEVESFVDAGKGELIDKKDLNPFDVIKAVAGKTGTIIQSPRKGCKKCYGRGYTGIETTNKSPIPCNCIYPPKTAVEKAQEKELEMKNFPILTKYQKRILARSFKNNLDKKKKVEVQNTLLKNKNLALINKVKSKIEQAKANI